MTKPVTRKMAVDCLLDRILTDTRTAMGDGVDRVHLLCRVCGEPLLPGQAIQFDHIHADALGGPHEYKNIRPIHYDPCHKAKSKRDVGALAKIDRITGLTCTGPKKQIPSRPLKSGNSFERNRAYRASQRST